MKRSAQPRAGRRRVAPFAVLALATLVLLPGAGAGREARAGNPEPAAAPVAAPAATLPLPPPGTDPTEAINQLAAARWKVAKLTPAPLCDDRAFARRIYLDLAGRIPSAEEVDEFLAECGPAPRPGSRPLGRARPAAAVPASPSHPAARARLADRLLAGPEYARRMRDVFDVVFMGRSSGPPRPRRREQPGTNYRTEWLAYLERAFAADRPWDRMLRDLLLARPEGDAERGAVWFLFARQDRYQEIAESVSPAVFGVQVQCAQCHDHPLLSELKQSHYWGLVAFFNRGKNRVTRTGPTVAEAATGGFGQYATLSGQSLPAELTFLGAPRVEEARPAADVQEKDSPELYRPPAGPAADEPPVPRFSRREQFVERVVRGNPRIARAAANRFWALLMGRGLVHPVDQMDSRHPAAHPELLDWLAADFERSGFDVRRLVRAIVLSRPYQLASKGATGPELFARGLEKPLSAEVLYRSLLVASTGKADEGAADAPGLLEALADVFPEVFPEENLTSLRQAMFMTNSPLIDALVQPKGSNTAARLAQIVDPAARTREAFRVAYAREPEADELRAATAYLGERKDRPQQATAQLWWALLAGAEFRFNH